MGLVGRGSRTHSLAKRALSAAQYERLSWQRRLPIKENTVFYESFSGNGMLCNPEAIFRALLEADDMRHLRHIWSLADVDRYAATVAEFARHPRVKFVRSESGAYYQALSTSQYLVNNATFPPMFAKRPGQTYLNTWHGTPLKCMGYDMPDGRVSSRNVLRNFLNCDYLLAPNDATANMYLDAYRMHNVFRGELICEGTPRIDRQFVDDDARARIRARLRAGGTVVSDRQRIVLYAPTWKGDFQAPTNDVRQLRNRIAALRAKIDTEQYCVLLKVHQQVYQFAAEDTELRPIIVSNAIPANEVLAATDVLITDYSSIFIDFLISEKPVLFFTPDLADYGLNRGWYLPIDQWPGPLCQHVDELANRLTAVGTGGPEDPLVSHAAAYAAARERYCAGEDGHAASRVIDIVFRNRTSGYDVRCDFTDDRETVLVYLGGVLPNGITMSALSLLDNIDYDRFDVSVFYPHQTRADRAALVDQVNRHVRLLPRFGSMLGGKLQMQALQMRRRTARRSHSTDVDRYAPILRDEWIRCFGAAKFDHVVDFSGYSPLWTKILLQGDAPSFAIWLHNDLRADSNREVNGKYPHRSNLQGMFDLYRYADHLVSVSPSLAALNRQSLRDFAPPERFIWARNTINFRQVLKQAYGLMDDEDNLFDPSARPLLAKHQIPAIDDDGVSAEVHPRDLRANIDMLMGYHHIEDIFAEAGRRARIHRILPPAPGISTFVTAGRLSPEKNHERLIRAFDRVHQEFPNTRLVILGGGPLYGALTRLVAELGLRASVTLAGHQANPYGVMAQSDCFVLSSEYEGQPMVLLEALVLGLPVVSTNFASVVDALPEGYGRIVEASVGALANGMRAFLHGEVRAAPFDHLAYNREATGEFYYAIGADGSQRTSPGDGARSQSGRP